MAIIFITGIDTGIGKSYVTGLWAKYLNNIGLNVTTAKLVQTGSQPVAEDIQLHRQLMNQSLSSWDQKGITCPYVFSYPASPHLAAKMEKKIINPSAILNNLNLLNSHYDFTLVEGAGGLRVPLNEHYTILDLIAQEKWPTLLVSSSRLGSINHTWLSIDSLTLIGCPILGIAYKQLMTTDPIIADETRRFFTKTWPNIPIIPIPWLESKDTADYPDFSMLQL